EPGAKRCRDIVSGRRRTQRQKVRRLNEVRRKGLANFVGVRARSATALALSPPRFQSFSSRIAAIGISSTRC
ncbi:MAG: hypothetical protein KDH19_18280, partial [Geminicoccaceae bacterium]|nr:hypothetical protein [Geminicoccaceae bacterium]